MPRDKCLEYVVALVSGRWVVRRWDSVPSRRVVVRILADVPGQVPQAARDDAARRNREAREAKAAERDRIRELMRTCPECRGRPRRSCGSWGRYCRCSTWRVEEGRVQRKPMFRVGEWEVVG